MRNKRLLGLLYLSVAHHPLCQYYRNHLIRLNNLALCLGCVGLYSGLGIGILVLVLINTENYDWELLIFLALMLYMPTILRLLNFPLFNSSRRIFKLLYRFLLGLGVAVGFLSILKVPNFFLGFFQFALGVFLYFSIAIKRVLSKDVWKECESCVFSPSPDCPGFSPFKLHKNKLKESY
ncbi:MAG: hypothetical protein ACFFAU_12265 [Candidatus Hodarchaeota archaeon]